MSRGVTKDELVRALRIVEILRREEMSEDVIEDELVEELAELAHVMWSGWMAYMFGSGKNNGDGTWTMPKWAVDRWNRQMTTLYPQLSEDEKESDRTEALRMIEIFRGEKMSEDVILKNDEYNFSKGWNDEYSSEKSDRLKDTMEHVIQNTVYTCLRGPRPSGAILYISMEHSIGMYPIYGHVVTPLGIKSCETLGKCMMENGHCVRCLHAEVAAIMAAARAGLITVDGVMFSINKPCYNCTLHIIEAGIKRIYYAYAVYDENRTREALEAVGIECIHVQID